MLPIPPCVTPTKSVHLYIDLTTFTITTLVTHYCQRIMWKLLIKIHLMHIIVQNYTTAQQQSWCSPLLTRTYLATLK